jgi:hypothetical protein
MRQIIGSSVAMLLVLTLAAPALAQSPTVDAGESPPAAPEGTTPPVSTGSPQIGDTVQYLSEGGVNLGSVTVDEVNPEFDEFSEFFDPNPDADYIGVIYTFEGGDESLEVNTFNLSLETGGGFLWSTAFVSRPDDVEVRDLESSFNLDPGDTETGLVVFEVPAGSELVRLWWQPDSGRLLELADLRGS